MKNDPPSPAEKRISISEIIGTIPDTDGEIEVCATAEVEYETAAEKVSVALDSFVRCLAGNGEHRSRPWLPPAERVTEHLPRSEATTFAKDVFKSWVKKVRAAIPHDA
jgi:hypothetical protein